MVPIHGLRRSMPLSVRLGAALTVASFFVALLVSFLAADQRAQEDLRSRDAAAARFGADLAARVAPLLAAEDQMRIAVHAAAARDLVGGRVLVLEGSGRVVIDTGAAHGDRQLGLLTVAGPFQRVTEREGDVPLREALAPVVHGGVLIGEVRLQQDAPPLRAGFPFGLFATVFLCCLSLVAVAMLVGHHWLGRVRSTTRSLLQLASGEAGRIEAPPEPAGAELSDLQQAMLELDKGMQEGLTRVAEGFLAMAQQVVEGLERRNLVPPGHGERTARYAALIAGRLKLEDQDHRDLETACRLQDLGKAWLRPSLLEKEGPLDEAELRSLGGHPLRAADLLYTLPGLRRAGLIVRHQNERYGGSGLPDGLRGDRIPLGARILAIASVYDLLTVCAVGDRPLDCQEALERMAAERGEAFDPWLLDLFVQEIAKAPPTRGDRPVMISAAGVVALQTAVGGLGGDFALEPDDDLDASAELDAELELVDEGGEELP